MRNNVDFIKVGKIIKSLRESANMSQSDLANELNVSKVAISQWENGSGIKTENLYDLIGYFNITIDDLINLSLGKENNHTLAFSRHSLNNHEDFSKIDKSNSDSLKKYLLACKDLILRFCELYKEVLQNYEIKACKEISILRKYFKIDKEYENKHSHDIDYIMQIMTNSSLNDDEKDFEISKYMELNFDFDPLMLLDSGDSRKRNANKQKNQRCFTTTFNFWGCVKDCS